MKSLNDAVRNEPLGAIAILVGLLPFLFDVARDYLFTAASIEAECEAPRDTGFSHEEGFLYYRSRCLIANQSRDPVSLTSLMPVMLSGDYPFPVAGRSVLFPTLERPYTSKLGRLYSEMAAEFPVNLGARESFAVDVVFISSVGELGPRDQKGECSKNLSFDRLSKVRMCIGEDTAVGQGRASQERYTESVKERIYLGFAYALADFDGFGLELRLGDGSRYIIEADLTDVKDYRCDEDIRQLSCNFGNADPRLIHIGREPEYNRWSLSWFGFLAALAATTWIGTRLLYVSCRYIYRRVSPLWSKRR